MSLLPLGTGPIGASGDNAEAGLPPQTGPTGIAELPIRVSVVSPAISSGAETVTDAGEQAAVWGVRVEVAGEDVSDSVIGEVVVEAEENAARVADFSLHQPSGTVVTPAAWCGRAVRIWLADMSTGVPTESMLLFSGVVDVPTVTPRSGMITLRCTDNRQGVLAAQDRATIAALLPGARYSPAIFDAGATSLVYAGDLLSTVPMALDLSPDGALRATQWAAKAIPDLSLDDDHVLDESVAVDLAERASLINRVKVRFGYRFPRMKAEGYLVSYDFLALAQTSFAFWVRDGGYFLQRAAVEAAIEQAGGSIISMTWIELPTESVPIPGTGGAWIPIADVHDIWCLGFAAVVSFDYGQQHEEDYDLTVQATASMTAVGVVQDEISGALEGVYDDPVAAEQNVLLFRNKISVIPPKSVATPIAGVTNSVDPVLTTDSDRAAAEAAIETLISIAMTRIHAAHRQHAVSASVPANPVIDLDKTIAIDAQGVTATGKVSRVVHRIDPAAGSAITEFRLAICSIAGVGVVHPADDVVAPVGSSDGTSNTLASPNITWNGQAGQDQVFTISFAGVEEAERAKAIHNIEAVYDAPLFEDVLEIVL